MELLLFVLMAYGLTQILVYSDMPIIKKLRPHKESYKGYGKVFHCPMCMGFHVGWFLLLLSPWTELFTFDATLVNAFMLGCLSSATSYVLNMVFSDEGIMIKHNYKQDIFSKIFMSENIQIISVVVIFCSISKVTKVHIDF